MTASFVAASGLAVLSPTAAVAAPCTTYYVSASAGSDTNSGCSSSAPWQTLAQVNATTFTAGNQILFADGDSWSGTLAPLGSGASGSPIVISSYGSGAAPIIAGGGAASAVHLLNQQYVTVQNLEITNTTATAAPRAGVLVDNTTSGILNGIHLVGNNIHDVLGFWNGAHGQPSDDSGISFNLSDSFAGNGWNDVLIDGNTLTHVDAGGIYIGSVAGIGHSIVTTNVVIQNNSITDAGGNDVVCIYCSSPLVQHNVTTDSGYRYSGAGYWMAINNGGLWQYNEIARQWRAASDGQAFDIDHDNTSVTVQYNYTHENPYGFFEFCCSSKTGALGHLGDPLQHQPERRLEQRGLRDPARRRERCHRPDLQQHDLHGAQRQRLRDGRDTGDQRLGVVQEQPDLPPGPGRLQRHPQHVVAQPDVRPAPVERARRRQQDHG